MEEFTKRWLEEEAAEVSTIEAWRMGDYVSQPCQNCGRHRLCVCTNGKHRCEKCNWCPEINEYAQIE